MCARMRVRDNLYPSRDFNIYIYMGLGSRMFILSVNARKCTLTLLWLG